MAVTVRKLFQNAKERYHSELLAGQSGLGNLVEWVHVVEDKQVGTFLHGQEIVFTTGIMMQDTKWLLEFAKNLYSSNASAFVLNLGGYIHEVPIELIDYCNEMDLPLFTIPWETRIVDMTRSFCQKIIENENTQISVESLMKNILFESGNMEEQIAQMERHGYRKDYRYNFVCISTDTEYGTQNYFSEIAQIKKIAERKAKMIHELYIAFTYREKIVVTLVDYTDEEQNNFQDAFFKELSKKKILSKVHIGLGENLQGLLKQKRNFDSAYMTNVIAGKRRERILAYRDMGVDKIIMAVKERDVLLQFYEETIGKLKKYDEETNGNLYEFMRIYLEEYGSVQAVSQRMFIHRNTVNNYLKKIEKVLELDTFGLEEKLKLSMAYHIADIL